MDIPAQIDVPPAASAAARTRPGRTPKTEPESGGAAFGKLLQAGVSGTGFSARSPAYDARREAVPPEGGTAPRDPRRTPGGEEDAPADPPPDLVQFSPELGPIAAAVASDHLGALTSGALGIGIAFTGMPADPDPTGSLTGSRPSPSAPDPAMAGNSRKVPPASLTASQPLQAIAGAGRSPGAAGIAVPAASAGRMERLRLAGPHGNVPPDRLPPVPGEAMPPAGTSVAWPRPETLAAAASPTPVAEATASVHQQAPIAGAMPGSFRPAGPDGPAIPPAALLAPAADGQVQLPAGIMPDGRRDSAALAPWGSSSPAAVLPMEWPAGTHGPMGADAAPPGPWHDATHARALTLQAAGTSAPGQGSSGVFGTESLAPIVTATVSGQGPAPAAGAAPVAGGPAMAASAGVQIAAAIPGEPGASRVNLRLDPPELGHVEMLIEVSDETRLHATLFSDRPATGELLRRHSEILVAQLRDAGFADVDLTFLNQHRQDRPGTHAGAGLAPERRQELTDRPAGSAGRDRGKPILLAREDRLDLRL